MTITKETEKRTKFACPERGGAPNSGVGVFFWEQAEVLVSNISKTTHVLRRASIKMGHGLFNSSFLDVLEHQHPSTTA